MSVARFFDLAHEQWPVTTGPVVTGNHNITKGFDGRLTVAIYLPDIGNWQIFYVTEDEFENPEELVAEMATLIEQHRQSHQKKG